MPDAFPEHPAPHHRELSFANPETGKTTVARVVAKIYCGFGLLKTDRLVEAERMDFVGQHLDSTAIKTSALIDGALDGVLFIDEELTRIAGVVAQARDSTISADALEALRQATESVYCPVGRVS